jgi:hypothetical protein
MDVFPIHHVKELIGLAVPELMRSITRWLDMNNLSVSDVRAFASVLHEFAEPESRYPQNPMMLQHIYIGFVVIAERDEILSILRTYGHLIPVTPSNDFRMAYVSGSVFAFRQLVLSPTKRLVSFANQIYIRLSHMGLGEIFKDYSKCDRPDGTFELVKL